MGNKSQIFSLWHFGPSHGLYGDPQSGWANNGHITPAHCIGVLRDRSIDPNVAGFM